MLRISTYLFLGIFILPKNRLKMSITERMSPKNEEYPCHFFLLLPLYHQKEIKQLYNNSIILFASYALKNITLFNNKIFRTMRFNEKTKGNTNLRYKANNSIKGLFGNFSKFFPIASLAYIFIIHLII